MTDKEIEPIETAEEFEFDSADEVHGSELGELTDGVLRDDIEESK